MSRRQLYLDVSTFSEGDLSRDLDTIIDVLSKQKANLILDPKSALSNWGIQCALHDAFGWDGNSNFEPWHIKRLREIAANVNYTPPIKVHKIIVLGKHDNCNMPHPGSD